MNETTKNKESIRHAVRQNFILYPEDYPTSGGDMSDDACDNLRTLVQSLYENRNEDEAQNYMTYVHVAIGEFIDYFEFEDDEEHWKFALEHF